MQKFVRDGYANISPRNPLRKLRDKERDCLCSLLRAYAATEGRRGPFSPLEAAGRTAARAGKLAAEMETNCFAGHTGQLLRPVLQDFENLTLVLRRFSRKLETHLELIGKPGHKNKTSAKRLLLMASELVYMTTGAYNDEHVAELLQSYRSEQADCSGDAIRKKREHLQKTYPDLYLDGKARIRKHLLTT
jgi:hypothetical protein